MNVVSTKRILHIVEDLKVGGLEKVLASIVLSLDKTKYDVQVWCLARGGEIAQALIAKGMAVRILEMDSYYSPLQIAALARLMKKAQFHIIHTHGYFASTFGRFAAILAHIPVVITHVHSTYYDYGKRNLLVERLLSYFTDRIICISQAVETFVTVNEGISKKKTCLIYNAVDLPVYIDDDHHKRKVRNSLCINPEAIVITVVASLTANKGHRILLEAFAQVFRNHPAARLVIVGHGPLRKELEMTSRQLTLDQAVIFLGIRNDVFELLQASEILVLPSQTREGLGV
ncbi:MAG: glycosyltransferase, partial [Syntrophales bacterium]